MELCYKIYVLYTFAACRPLLLTGSETTALVSFYFVIIEQQCRSPCRQTELQTYPITLLKSVLKSEYVIIPHTYKGWVCTTCRW